MRWVPLNTARWRASSVRSATSKTACGDGVATLELAIVHLGPGLRLPAMPGQPTPLFGKSSWKFWLGFKRGAAMGASLQAQEVASTSTESNDESESNRNRPEERNGKGTGR